MNGLKENIKSAIDIFKSYHYKIPYDKILTSSSLFEVELSDEEKRLSLQQYLNLLAAKNRIRLLLIDRNNKRFISKTKGPELFMRETCTNFIFHSNCGRIVHLPAGCNKLESSLHNFHEIAKLKFNKKTKVTASCPLTMKENILRKLEKKYNIIIEIFRKERSGATFSIKRLRPAESAATDKEVSKMQLPKRRRALQISTTVFNRKLSSRKKEPKSMLSTEAANLDNLSSAEPELLQFHFEPCSGKLFLITNNKLYFRGFLKQLRTE